MLGHSLSSSVATNEVAFEVSPGDELDFASAVCDAIDDLTIKNVSVKDDLLGLLDEFFLEVDVVSLDLSGVAPGHDESQDIDQHLVLVCSGEPNERFGGDQGLVRRQSEGLRGWP